jgi:uncharacterized protein GlcG (DUF336 family)
MTTFTRRATISAVTLATSGLLFTSAVRADDGAKGGKDAKECAGLPTHAELQTALATATAAETSGLNNQMWATVVNRDGVVCAVAYSGSDRAAQWPGSRVISAQKANTANAFSLPGLALSTANLYTAVQPGGSLFGLQESNPVDVSVAYGGNSRNYGQPNDPMVGGKIGGVNVFGGGVALYGPGHVLLGALGVSGDSSCADHNIAWRTRNNLNLDFVPSGVSGDAMRPDNIVYDQTSGWAHPVCAPGVVGIAANLPPTK